MIKKNIIDLATNLLLKLENLRLSAYLDSAGHPTIAIGETEIDGRKVTLSDHCTKEQALLWLTNRLELNYAKLESFCNTNEIELEDNQAATLLSFIYNAGWAGFLSSSIARDLISKNTEKVTTDLLKWNKIRIDGNLVFSTGLFNRRMQENKCFIDERQCT